MRTLKSPPPNRSAATVSACRGATSRPVCRRVTSHATSSAATARTSISSQTSPIRSHTAARSAETSTAPTTLSPSDTGAAADNRPVSSPLPAMPRSAWSTNGPGRSGP